MEVVRCPTHPESFCILKTGTKPGKTKDVSFYLCTQCSFVKTTKLPPVICKAHSENVVEIQALFEVTKKLWRNFRCLGREKGKSWCGCEAMTEQNEDCSQHDAASGYSTSREDVSSKTVSSNVKKCDNQLTTSAICDKKTGPSAASPKGGKESKNLDGYFVKDDMGSKLVSGEKSSDESGVILISDEDEDYSNDNKPVGGNKSYVVKSTEKTRRSPELPNFSDLSKLHSKSSLLHVESQNFQNKSFTQYRESPATIRSSFSQRSKARHESSSLDSDDEKSVTQAEQLFENIDISEKKNTLASESQNGVDKVPQEDIVKLNAEKDKYVCQLVQLQASLKTVKLDALPDKGQRIHEKMKFLEDAITSLDKKMANASVQASDHSPSQTVQSKISGPQVVRVYPSKPGQTDHGTVHVVERPQLVSGTTTLGVLSDTKGIGKPSQDLQHFFSANPQAMNLYGGRMTAQRLFEVGAITTEAITKLHKQLETCPDASEELPDPDGLQVTLMPHQRHALAWLEWREHQHPPSGVLADDMGLGKTLTMLSHVLRQKLAQEASTDAASDSWLGKKEFERLMEKGMKRSRATLIIAPASLIHQWANEIDRRCRSRLKYLIYHGPNREIRMHKLINQDVVITTYAIVSREVGINKDNNVEKPVKDDDEEAETPQSSEKKSGDLPLLMRIGWERIILDEAHEIKNHKSIKAQSVSRLRAAYRWALTGTPIQNDLKDMYSLLRFLRFSPFDELKVWKKHIESARGSTQRLNTIVKALLLRRTKKDFHANGEPLVKLPSKDCQIIRVELSPEERKIYNKLFRKTQSTVREYVLRHQDTSQSRGGTGNQSEPAGAVGGYDIGHSFAGVSVNTDLPSNKRGTGSQILVLLLRLRQCCCHLGLMKEHLEKEGLETDGIELSLEEQMQGLVLDNLMELKDAKEASMNQTSLLLEKSSQSTKLKSVMDKVKDIKQTRPGDKCVIVSQWTSMLEIVALHLKKEGIQYSLIQGNIPAQKRAYIVDDFNHASGSAEILLVSLRAGGVGLNLIGGNHLFLLDCHWNPALEEQACDRIYRLGQKKDIFIYRFLCKDTIEEKISLLQQGKLKLAKSVLTGSDTTRQKLSLNDLRTLFGV